MESELLMEKLIDIERAIDSVSSVKLRYMVIDAQECFLQIQRERATAVRPAPRAMPLFPLSRAR